jgi:hypothetical protein
VYNNEAIVVCPVKRRFSAINNFNQVALKALPA